MTAAYEETDRTPHGPAAGSSGPGYNALVAELRQPLSAVIRSLQRLTLQRLSTPGASVFATPLIRRARSLAQDLHDVVEQLIDAALLDETAASGAHQQALTGRELVDLVESEVRDYLDPSRLRFDVPADLVITTHHDRVSQIVVNLVAGAARRSGDQPVTVTAALIEQAFQLDVSWPEPQTTSLTDDDIVGLPMARVFAGSLGGTIEIVESRADIVARVRLPQKRGNDSSGRPRGE